MAVYFYVIAAMCVAVSAAPPAPPRLYPQHAQAQLQQINPLDYYLDNPEVHNYYNQAQQKQANNGPSGAPARLETLEPDSEVELIPGAQQPQQPPQQNPVSPNLPGLLPGQRVFIVHMPVPGYRPGTIGGYQPVYIVAAGPQGNAGYPGSGYQNAVLVDPSGQQVGYPLVGYQRPGAAGAAPQGANPGFVLGSPLTYNRPFDLAYHQDPALAYQQAQAQQQQAYQGNQGPVRLSQLVGLQSQPARPADAPRPANEAESTEPKRIQVRGSTESKEGEEKPRRNASPTPPHAQIRNKA